MKFIPFALLLILSGCGAFTNGDALTDSCFFQTTAVNDFAVGIGNKNLSGNNTALNEVAQSFQVDEDKKVRWVDLYLRKKGNAAGILTLEIRNDSSGFPTGSSLATSTVAVSTIRTNVSNFYTFELDSVVSLSDATPYWIHVGTSAAPNTSQYVEWLGSQTDPYGFGQIMYEAVANGQYTDTGTTETDTILRLCANPEDNE